MNEIVSIIISVVLFIVIMIIFTNKRVDYVAFTILSAVIACVITGSIFGIGFTEFLAGTALAT